MAVELELLRTACYFSKLDVATLDDIRPFIFERKLPAGEGIMWEGEEGDVLFCNFGFTKALCHFS